MNAGWGVFDSVLVRLCRLSRYNHHDGNKKVLWESASDGQQYYPRGQRVRLTNYGDWMQRNVRLRGRNIRRDAILYARLLSNGQRNMFGIVLRTYWSKTRVDIIVTSLLLGWLLIEHIKGGLIGLPRSCLFLWFDNESLNCFHKAVYD